MTTPHLPHCYVYLILSQRGEIYTGSTANLRQRFKEHNSPSNTGWTRGRRWHLLAVKRFLDRDSALRFEKQLKRSRYDKRNWVTRAHSVSARLSTLCDRYGIRCGYDNPG